LQRQATGQEAKDSGHGQGEWRSKQAQEIQSNFRR